jgi:poly-gamma-glutamate synthesis protein (capsule biosynthesis protein)
MLYNLTLLIAALCGAPGLIAAPIGQSDPLDAPLTHIPQCGPGDPRDLHFTIAATGDTFPHENIQAVGEAQGYDVLFDYLRPFLSAADLAYTNFDGAMLSGSPYTGYPNFNYNPALATALKNAGIDAVSTANNHILDRGPQGLDATLAVLDAAGIMHHGAAPSSAAADPRPPYLPIELARDGATIRIGFISATWGTNGIPDPYNQVNLLFESNGYGAQSPVRQSILDAIAAARSATDLVVVAAHWGQEYQQYPDAGQVAAARRMAEAGADIIIGAQPHTLQPLDTIIVNGRTTIVAYSLANFLASQGAFQVPHYSATSVVLYIGIVRRADGSVGLTGVRYLPTIHVDADTRPAPIPPQGYEPVIDHVRLKMRDPGGLRQVSHDPAALGGSIAVCPPFILPNGAPVYGDFAQHYAMLGAESAAAALGTPLGPPVIDLAGDCRTPMYVLTTEQQRLEHHPDAGWPYRISGTHLGAVAFRQRYGLSDIARRTDLATAFAHPAFRTFFERHGGLPVFGYPVSDARREPGHDGAETTVQYFERARFELSSDAADPAGVRVTPLGRAYLFSAILCGEPVPTITPPPLATTAPGSVPPTLPTVTATPPAATPTLARTAAPVAPQPEQPATPEPTAWRHPAWPILFTLGLAGVALVLARGMRRRR